MPQYKIVPNITVARNSANAAADIASAAFEVANNAYIRQFSPNTETDIIEVSNTYTGNVLQVFTGNVFVDVNSAFTIGQYISIYNDSDTDTVTLTENTNVTLHYHNTVNVLSNTYTGNRLIGPKGYVTLTCVNTDVYIVTGAGIQ